MTGEPSTRDGTRAVAEGVKAGRDPRTPFAALGGTALALLLLFLIALAAVVVAYLVAG